MNQKIYLITGLMASGKSTVSDLLAKSIEKCVHLRGDVFRKMIISGRENMSATPSAEAVRQLYLRYKLTADAAKSKAGKVGSRCRYTDTTNSHESCR